MTPVGASKSHPPTRHKVKKAVVSEGVMPKFGYPVRDATEAMTLPLTRHDIQQAAKRRNGYDVNDEENFTECALAICLHGKIPGARVSIQRVHAYVLLPDAEYVLRYVLDKETQRIISLNDQGRFEEMEPNTMVHFLPPPPKQRLSVMRHRAKKNADRIEPIGERGRALGIKPHGRDPYEGVLRNGSFDTAHVA